MDEQQDLFYKPLSLEARNMISNSMAELARIGMSKNTPLHLREPMLEYFNKLKDLMERDGMGPYEST